jgi:hypothetical protein
MKILLIAVAAVVLLVLIVVAIGALLPKHHISTRSAHFNASPDQLFPLIAGPQNWRPDVAQCEDITDNEGRHFQRETNRRNETMTYELLASKPSHSIQRRIATPNLPYSGTWTFTLTPADNGTSVRITEDGEVYNPIFRFTSHFILGETATIDAYLRALGKATDQNVTIEN